MFYDNYARVVASTDIFVLSRFGLLSYRNVTKNLLQGSEAASISLEMC